MKTINEKLIKYADEALRESCILEEKSKINETYRGYTAALGVSIVMIGLRPTLAIYYQDKTKTKANPQKVEVIEVIAKMLTKQYPDKPINGAKDLLNKILEKNNEELKQLQKDIINCSIALKYVIRTYELVKKGD
jgi:CRISPR type III-B/RAMP module-associated protein Cmr5